ncbi:hypothetical protein B0H10DRAFT_1638209, partial [Mycena sp. CBHHK59/15]
LNWGDVLEIQAPSGAGKTQLLYFLLVTCIMPSPQGWGRAAVVFDTDGTFDSCRLRDLLVLRLQALSATSEDTQHLAEIALHRVHLFRPVSSAQLAASLFHLPVYHTAQMPNAEMGLVVVDSMSAFYWPDRFIAEHWHQPHTSYTAPLQHTLTGLQNFRVSHSPVTILTNWGLLLADTNHQPTTSPLFYKQHLQPFPS